MEAVKHVVLACIITLGLVAALAYQFESPPGSHRSAREAVPAPAAPCCNAQGIPAFPGDESQSVAAEPRQAAPSFDDLRSACVAEAKRGGAPGGGGSACREYERITATKGDPTINTMASVSASPPRLQQPRRPNDSDTTIAAVTPMTCDGLGYGSIRYRDCRATEKKRLLGICKRSEERADDTTGDMRAPMLALARENCRIADLYRIVN